MTLSSLPSDNIIVLDSTNADEQMEGADILDISNVTDEISDAFGDKDETSPNPASQDEVNTRKQKRDAGPGSSKSNYEYVRLLC